MIGALRHTNREMLFHQKQFLESFSSYIKSGEMAYDRKTFDCL
jgi:hypothetical protein